MSAPVTIRDLMTDSDLFGQQFGVDSWSAWRALLAAFYGLQLSKAEQGVVEALTGRHAPPEAASEELWLVMGRRGGKSQAAGLLAVYEACFNDHRDKLSPGEVATVMVLAADRKQAKVVFRYISGLLNGNPMLKRLIVREDKETIELNNRCVIEVTTASFRSVRGYTVAAVIADEIAFWRSDESANPDTEILRALRPAMATLRGKLIALSSPYSKRGALWNTYRRHFGKASPVLVAQAPTLTMNPTLPDKLVADALEDDASAAKAEYLAEFRDDLEQFITREVVEAAVRTSPLELPFNRAHRYHAFVDPAGGGQDEFCIAIGHHEDEAIVVDVVRARRGTPAEIVAGYASLLASYRIKQVTGDKYAGSWPADEFKKHGIDYHPSEQPKSGLYLDLLPALTSGRVELPPDTRLINQISGLERRTSRAGRDSIDHGPGGHDDRANVVAGLVTTKHKSRYDLERLVNGDPVQRTETSKPIAAIKAAGIPL